MEEILASLRNNMLFEGISQSDMVRMYNCLSPKKATYKKNDYIFRANEDVGLVFIMLSGSAHIIEQDFWGNQSIIETLQAPVFFGEAYALSGMEKHLVNVVTAEDSDVLLIESRLLFEGCSNACPCHATLLKNTSCILAKKVVLLTQKMIHVGQRTTRKKLISFFSICAARENRNIFTIPYSRQQLADYLAVERSALSHELSRMRDEGFIRYQKSRFELLALIPVE